MKNIALLVMLFAGSAAFAQYRPVDKGSSVHFTIKNFGIRTGGSFSGLQGNIKFDISHPEQAGFDVSIDANTINTGIDMRDDHLRAETYFDVKNYPRIRFTSTRVTTSSKPAIFMIYGRLTIKNQSKDISFPFTAKQTSNGYLFNGTFTINRRDFGVGGSSVISDNLDVDLEILASK
jgi:polyisoprenoid-binding protein YceI